MARFRALISLNSMSARVLALLLVFGVACGGTQVAKTTATGLLSIECNVKDAEVWVNDIYAKTIGSGATRLKLPAGQHRIEIRHEAFHSMYYEVQLDHAERETLVVELIEMLP